MNSYDIFKFEVFYGKDKKSCIDFLFIKLEEKLIYVEVKNIILF